eukprot:1580931-Amphidinium_carterae.1
MDAFQEITSVCTCCACITTRRDAAWDGCWAFPQASMAAAYVTTVACKDNACKECKTCKAALQCLPCPQAVRRALYVTIEGRTSCLGIASKMHKDFDHRVPLLHAVIVAL